MIPIYLSIYLSICLSIYLSVYQAELARLGLKCGGAPPQRAERLWLTKGVALSDLQQVQLDPR